MIRRVTIVRGARRLGSLARCGWEVFTPLAVAMTGLFFTRSTGSEILGGLMIAWGVDLAYQRGKAAENRRVGRLIAEMVCGERSVDINVVHEHRLAPATSAEMRP